MRTFALRKMSCMVKSRSMGWKVEKFACSSAACALRINDGSLVFGQMEKAILWLIVGRGCEPELYSPFARLHGEGPHSRISAAALPKAQRKSVQV